MQRCNNGNAPRDAYMRPLQTFFKRFVGAAYMPPVQPPASVRKSAPADQLAVSPAKLR